MSLNHKLELNLAICFITWAVTSFLHAFVPIYSKHCNNHTVTNILLIDLCTFKEGHINHHLFFASHKVTKNVRCSKKKKWRWNQSHFFFFFNWSIIALQCCLSSHWQQKESSVCIHISPSWTFLPLPPRSHFLIHSFIHQVYTLSKSLPKKISMSGTSSKLPILKTLSRRKGSGLYIS